MGDGVGSLGGWMQFSVVAPNLNDTMVFNDLVPELDPTFNCLDIRKTPNDIIEMSANSLEEKKGKPKHCSRRRRNWSVNTE